MGKGVGRSSVHIAGIWVALSGCLSSGLAYAIVPSTENVLLQSTVDVLVKTIGISMDHRPYEPAKALGTFPGLSIGVEVTLVQTPPELGSALNQLSGSSSSSGSPSIPVLPSARLHFHKGMGKRVDLGFSIFPSSQAIPYIGKSLLVGGDLKVVVLDPEEGPTWAIRLTYNVNTLSYQYSPVDLTVKTTTISPQLLVSKDLGFAEPYIGAAFQYVVGSARAAVSFPELAGLPAFSVERQGVARSGLFFGGLVLKVPYLGFLLTLEGAYSTTGMNQMGTKIGFAF